MSVSTENSSEKSLEKVLEDKPVSVCSVNFTQIINNYAEMGTIEKAVKPENIEALNNRSSVSGMIFRWRNAIAVLAIFAVGVLHFAFQMSLISREITENRSAAEVPPVKNEQLFIPSADNKPVEQEAKKADVVLPEKVASRLRPRQFEISPVKPVEIMPVKPALRKKETVETRAERLRRAERILTGV